MAVERHSYETAIPCRHRRDVHLKKKSKRKGESQVIARS